MAKCVQCKDTGLYAPLGHMLIKCERCVVFKTTKLMPLLNALNEEVTEEKIVKKGRKPKVIKTIIPIHDHPINSIKNKLNIF